jgi:plastocyanin
VRALRVAPILVTALSVLAGCGGDGDGAGFSSEPVPDDPDVVVLAENMAFDPDELRLPADEPVTVVIDNRDRGINHNIHFEGAPEPNRTSLERGVSQQALTVTLPAGEYTYICDIHPNMTGTAVAD